MQWTLVIVRSFARAAHSTLFPRVPSSLYTLFFLFLSSLDSDSIKRYVGQVNLDVWGLTRFSRKTPKNRIIYKISKKSENYKTQKILLFFWYAVPRCSAIHTSNAPASLSLSTRSFGFGFSSFIRKGMLPWFQSDSALLTRHGRQKKQVCCSPSPSCDH